MLCLQISMFHILKHGTKSKPILSHIKSADIMSKVGHIDMDGWTKFFVWIGVSVVVYAVCQIIFWLDDPRKRNKRK